MLHTALTQPGRKKRDAACSVCVCDLEWNELNMDLAAPRHSLTSSVIAGQLPVCNCNNSNNAAVMLDSLQAGPNNCGVIYTTGIKGEASAQTAKAAYVSRGGTDNT